MTPLTAEEFIRTLSGAKVQLVPEPPKTLLHDGDIVIWPSFTADYEDPPGRHVEALVFQSKTGGSYVMIMVSKRVYEALGGVT